VAGAAPAPPVAADLLPIEPDSETSALPQTSGSLVASDGAQVLAWARRKGPKRGPDRGGKTAPAERGLSKAERRLLKATKSRLGGAREASPQSAMPRPFVRAARPQPGAATPHFARHGPPADCGRHTPDRTGAT
jgi:hypothetical protein